MRRNFVIGFMTLSAFLTAALLGGCGSGNKEGVVFPVSQATVIDNTNCTNACHAASVDPVNGKSIVFQWLTSAHVKGAFGLNQQVDCQGCHGPGSLHWGVGPIPFPNPDTAGVCASTACHSNSASAALRPSPAHFSVPPNASYITSNSTCSDCHNPHDNRTQFPVNQVWAGSAHADTTGLPFTEQDFKMSATCNRCHTTTGYLNFLSSHNLNQPAWGTAGDTTKQVIACNACHVNYSWTLNSGITGAIPAGNAGAGSPGVQLPYPVNPGTFVNPKIAGVFTNCTTHIFYVLPTTGESDLCSNCHSFRKSGRNVILTTITNTTSFATVREHYLGAAGTLNNLAGYEFQPHSAYSFQATHLFIGGTVQGPCVGCHLWLNTLQSPFPNHSLDPATVTDGTTAPVDINGTVTAIPASSVCNPCHVGSGLPFDGSAATLNTQKALYAARIAALQSSLQARGIFYDSTTDPYFFDSANVATRKPYTTWVTAATAVGGTATANQVIGTAFNLQLCVKEPGGYVHNNTYTAELLYDSLDLLDNGLIDGSYSNAAIGFATRP